MASRIPLVLGSTGLWQQLQSGDTLFGLTSVNSQTSTTYTIVFSDCGKLITFSNAISIAVTLPQATGSFTTGWTTDIQNLGSGSVTITPTTSTIDGQASVTISAGQGLRIFSNGTNYFTQRGSSVFPTTLTGDVTGTGTSSISTSVVQVHGVSYPASPSTNTVPVVTSSNTITYQSIANAQMSTMATLTIKGNNTGSTATPIDLSVSQVLTMLGAGTASGLATLDGTGKLSTSQIPTALVGDLAYQGTWNASTNSPTLVSGTGTKGYMYKVSTSGSTTIDGNSTWYVGDMIIFDGTVWDKLDGPSVTAYTLPNATTSTLGGVIVGTGLAVASGTVSIASGAAATNVGTLSGVLTGTLPSPGLAIGSVTGVHTSISLTSAESSATTSIGSPVYISGSGAFKRSLANSYATSGVIGLATAAITSSSSGYIATQGVLTLTTGQWDAIVTGESGGLTAGSLYFVDPTTIGNLTSTVPTTVGQVIVCVGRALSSTTLLIEMQEPILL